MPSQMVHCREPTKIRNQKMRTRECAWRKFRKAKIITARTRRTCRVSPKTVSLNPLEIRRAAKTDVRETPTPKYMPTRSALGMGNRDMAGGCEMEMPSDIATLLRLSKKAAARNYRLAASSRYLRRTNKVHAFLFF